MVLAAALRKSCCKTSSPSAASRRPSPHASGVGTARHSARCRRWRLARRLGAHCLVHPCAPPSWPSFRKSRSCGLRAFHRNENTRTWLSEARLEFGKEIFAGSKGIRRLPNTNPACYPPSTGAVVELRRQQIGLHPAFNVIVRGLQQDCRFSRVHGRVVEIELSHSAAFNAVGRCKASSSRCVYTA